MVIIKIRVIYFGCLIRPQLLRTIFFFIIQYFLFKIKIVTNNTLLPTWYQFDTNLKLHLFNLISSFWNQCTVGKRFQSLLYSRFISSWRNFRDSGWNENLVNRGRLRYSSRQIFAKYFLWIFFVVSLVDYSHSLLCDSAAITAWDFKKLWISPATGIE